MRDAIALGRQTSRNSKSLPDRNLKAGVWSCDFRFKPT